MQKNWRARFYACLVISIVLVIANGALAVGMYRAAGDGVVLSYFREYRNDCQAHLDLLDGAARGNLTKDDFTKTRVFVVRHREGETRVPLNLDSVSFSFDERGKYVSSTYSTSSPTK